MKQLLKLCLNFMHIECENIETLREQIGSTDPSEARVKMPKSISAKYGTELPFNAIHLSDSIESGQRELEFCRENNLLTK
jgi:nucleoside diphosphate kinase